MSDSYIIEIDCETTGIPYLIGPFEKRVIARRWAETNAADKTWRTVRVSFPYQHEGQPDLGDDFELRELKRWTVHCAHCGMRLIKEVPQTDKVAAHLQRVTEGRKCRNRDCVSNGGTKRKREPYRPERTPSGLDEFHPDTTHNPNPEEGHED